MYLPISLFWVECFFFLIKCKYCIDQKVVSEAYETSWKSAEQMNIHNPSKGTSSLKREKTLNHNLNAKSNKENDNARISIHKSKRPRQKWVPWWSANVRIDSNKQPLAKWNSSQSKPCRWIWVECWLTLDWRHLAIGTWQNSSSCGLECTKKYLTASISSLWLVNFWWRLLLDLPFIFLCLYFIIFDF